MKRKKSLVGYLAHFTLRKFHYNKYDHTWIDILFKHKTSRKPKQGFVLNPKKVKITIQEL